jgi:hypothetical protein
MAVQKLFDDNAQVRRYVGVKSVLATRDEAPPAFSPRHLPLLSALRRSPIVPCAPEGVDKRLFEHAPPQVLTAVGRLFTRVHLSLR